MTRKRSSKKFQTTFEPRIRFNWGYHDAAHVVEHELDNAMDNFGFGPALRITSSYDVVTRHFDHAYAIGWQAGYQDAKDGYYVANGRNSENAWKRDGHLI